MNPMNNQFLNPMMQPGLTNTSTQKPGAYTFSTNPIGGIPIPNTVISAPPIITGQKLAQPMQLPIDPSKMMAPNISLMANQIIGNMMHQNPMMMGAMPNSLMKPGLGFGGPGPGMAMNMAAAAAAASMQMGIGAMQMNQMGMGQMGMSTGIIKPADRTDSTLKKVFVKNIPEDVPDSFMESLLRECGNIVAWKRTRNEKDIPVSFGYCEFETVEGVLRCLPTRKN